MRLPKVTVAVVTLNACGALEPTLRSIRRQTYPNVELIVVDGGSTDRTLDTIRSPRWGVSRWLSEPDHGPYDAMNKAAELGSGEYIVFMNAGDWFADDTALEQCLRHAPAAADFIFGHHYYRTLDGALRLHRAADFESTWNSLLSGDFSSRWQSGVPCHQATLTRRALLIENRYNLDYRIAADHEFMYRMRARGARFHHANIVVAVYTQGGLSTANEALCAHEWWRLASTFGPADKATRFFQRAIRPSVTHHPKIVAEIVERVRQSGLVFEDWYRTHYLARRPGVDPVEHYLFEGWREGCNPMPFFDTKYYLNTYADVRAEGLNPLEHYMTRGLAERRATLDWGDTSNVFSLFGRLFDPHTQGLDELVRTLGKLDARRLIDLLPPRPVQASLPADVSTLGSNDGNWTAIAGVSEVTEGPYPELGLPQPFRWSVDPSTTLRVFSTVAGRRQAVVTVRNIHEGQQLTILAREGQVSETWLATANIAEPIPIRFSFAAVAGYQNLELRCTRQSNPDGLGRRLALIVERFEWAQDQPAEVGGVMLRWDRSRDLGPLEGPYPELDLPLPFRWITARECALVLEAQEDCDVTLRLDYRCHIPGQEALLCVNGTEPRPIGLRAGSISEPRSWTTPLRLRRGENVIEIRFRHTVQETSGGRELALLLEDVSIA